MNKYFLTIITSLILTVGAPYQQAQASTMELAVCESIAKNDKTSLRRITRKNKVKIKHLYASIQCNGHNLISFAAKRNADVSAEFIISKLPRNEVKRASENIQANERIRSLIQERLNG